MKKTGSNFIRKETGSAAAAGASVKAASFGRKRPATNNPLLLFCLAFALVLLLTGCGAAEYRYSIVSSDVYLAGDYMRGPATRSIDVEVILNSKTIKSGTTVDFYYFGTLYRGKVSGNQIIWDKTPYMVSDGTVTKSTIEQYNSGIKMKHSYRMDNYSLVTGEIIQVFELK